MNCLQPAGPEDVSPPVPVPIVRMGSPAEEDFMHTHMLFTAEEILKLVDELEGQTGKPACHACSVD